MLSSGDFILRFSIEDWLAGGFYNDTTFRSLCPRRPLRAVRQDKEVDNDEPQPHKASGQRSSRAVSPFALS